MWNKRRSLNWYFSSHASELNGPSSELYWPNFIISSHEICNFTSYSSTSAVDVVLTFAMWGKIYKSLWLPSQSTTDPTTCHAGSSEPRKISRRDSLGGSKKVWPWLALPAEEVVKSAVSEKWQNCYKQDHYSSRGSSPGLDHFSNAEGGTWEAAA